MQPVVENLPSAKRFSALDVICPNPDCLAPASTPCRAARVCQERVAEALRRVREGSLELAAEPEITRPAECTECGKERTQRGSPKACSDACRCQRYLPSRKRCVAPIKPGTSYCRAHQPPPGSGRWTDSAFARGGGRG
jgi:hypothetical protein